MPAASRVSNPGGTADLALPRLGAITRGAAARPAALERNGLQWSDTRGQTVALSGWVDGRPLAWLEGRGLFELSEDSSTVRVEALPGASVASLRDGFLRVVLPLFQQAMGAELLHASAVSTPAGVVGFCGASGVGKSTLAVELERRGYGGWADDQLVYRATPAGFVTRFLPFQHRLAGRSSSAAGKVYHGQALQQPLAALCLLARGDGGIETLPAPRAFAGLLAHACCLSLEDPTRKGRMLETLFDLAATVPVSRVALPVGLGALRGWLGELEARVLR